MWTTELSELASSIAYQKRRRTCGPLNSVNWQTFDFDFDFLFLFLDSPFFLLQDG